MLFHVIFWISSSVIAFVCLMRVWNLGKNGFDDQQLPKDWILFRRSEVWVGLGAALVLFAFVDMFNFFNPVPPALNGAFKR